GDSTSPWLSFVIVGGGPTGVELAGALGEIARKTLKDDFRSLHPEQARIILLDSATRLLPAFSERVSKKAEEALIRLGVQTRCVVRVTNIDSEGITLERADGTSCRIAARTVLWAGGVTTTDIVTQLAQATGAPVDQRGRIMVQP